MAKNLTREYIETLIDLLASVTNHWERVTRPSACRFFGKNYSEYRLIANKLIEIKKNLFSLKASKDKGISAVGKFAEHLNSIQETFDSNYFFLYETLVHIELTSYCKVTLRYP